MSSFVLLGNHLFCPLTIRTVEGCGHGTYEGDTMVFACCECGTIVLDGTLHSGWHNDRYDR